MPHAGATFGMLLGCRRQSWVRFTRELVDPPGQECSLVIAPLLRRTNSPQQILERPLSFTIVSRNALLSHDQRFFVMQPHMPRKRNQSAYGTRFPVTVLLIAALVKSSSSEMLDFVS